MASPNRPVAAGLLLVAAAALAAALLLVLCSTGSSEDGYLGRVGLPWGASSLTALPFSPTDVLPLLPRGVAMAALWALRGVSDIFPVFVGAASAGGPGSASGSGAKVRWKGACFYDNEAWLVFHNESGSRYGGGTLHIKVRRLLPTRARFCSSGSPYSRRRKMPKRSRAEQNGQLLALSRCCVFRESTKKISTDYRWETVRSHFDLGRYQTDLNSKFKFKFKK